LDKDAILPGLQLARINPAVINELNLQLNASGVVVTSPGPYGERVGLRVGDIIEEVRGKAITAPFDVEKTLAAGGRNVSIRVLRGDGRVQLRFRL
jgi:S1-C subfamily serine protease